MAEAKAPVNVPRFPLPIIEEAAQDLLDLYQEAIDRTRLEKATEIVYDGKLTYGEHGVVTVQGSDEKRPYLLTPTKNGVTCTCPDYTQRHTEYCKHRVAVILVQNIQDLMAAEAQEGLGQQGGAEAFCAPGEEPDDPDASLPVEPPATPLPEPPAPTALRLSGAVMTEAPYSVNVRVISPAGFQFQVTVRKQGHTELLDAMGSLEKVFGAKGYTAAERPYGNGQNSQPPAQAPADPNLPPEFVPCPLHPGLQMKRRTKDGQYYHSHKVGHAWCNGRPKQGV